MESMNRNPVKWAVGSFAIHSIAPGFLWLVLESERPNEGLARAMTIWPFSALLGYVPAIALFTYALVRSAKFIPTKAASSAFLVGAIVLLDFIAFAIAWMLGPWGYPVPLIVLLLPIGLSLVVLFRRKTVLQTSRDRF